jgi:uncharacterized protein (DUF302 family)
MRTVDYGLSATVERPFDVVVDEVKAALAEQGFGVLTEIDIKATLKKKLDVDVDQQVILGACNPTFAHQALQLEPSIGLLLPCNVVVRSDGSSTTVEMINPQTMVDVTQNPQMAEVASSVTALLASALKQVAP